MLVLAVLAACGVFLTSPPGKALVLRAVAASLRSRLGVEARAAALEYRILSCGVTLHGVTVTQTGATRPFISAERVDVDFASGILFGNLALRRLDVTKPEVELDPTTRTPLAAPRAAGTPAATLPSFDIRRVDLRDLNVTTISGAGGTRIIIRGVTLALAGEGPGQLRGDAVASGGLSVLHSGVAVRLDRVRADISLAGTSLSLTSIGAESRVARVNATAHYDMGGNLDVRYDGQVDIHELHRWWADAPPVSGALDVSGSISGTLDDPVATLTARGGRLGWRDVTDATMSLSGRWSGGDLVIDRYDVSSIAGAVLMNGRARMAVAGAGRSSSLRLDARARDPRRLARLTRARALPAVPPVTLVADVTWPGPVPAAATIEGRVQMAALDAPSVPLATLEARGRDGRWAVRQRAALADGTNMTADVSVVVDPASFSRSTVDGRIAAQSGDVAAALRDLGRRGLAAANLGASLRDGRATADARMTGTLASPRLEAKVKAESFTLAGVDQVRADAEVRVAGRSVEISRLTVRASGNRLDLHGTATIGAGPVDLRVDGRLESLDLLAPRLPAHWRPAGSLAFSGTLAGSSADPHLALRVSGSGLETNGIVIDTLDGALSFERDVLRVSDLRLNRGDGWLRLDGDVDRRLQHMKVRGRGEKLALSLRQLKAPGPVRAADSSVPEALRVDALSVQIDVAGTPAQPAGTISATAGNLGIEGRMLGPFTLSAEGADGTARFTVALADHRADVTGSVGFVPAWPYEAHATLRASELPSLVALMGPTAALPDISGTITASADVEGRLDRPMSSSGVIDVPALEGELKGKPLRLVQPGRIRFEGPRVTVEQPFRMTLGGFALGLAPRADERNGGGVVATIEGRIEDGLAFLPPGVNITPWLVEGPVRAHLSLKPGGEPLAISGDADATLDRLTRAGQELARDVRVRAQIRGGAIEISEAIGTVLGGPFTGTGRFPIDWVVPSWLAAGAAGRETPSAEATASARADLTLTRVLQALGRPRDDVSGSAKVAIEARAAAPRLERVEATLDVEAGEIAINKVSLSQQGPTRLRLNNGGLEVSELAWKGPRSEVTASGAIGLLPGVDGELRAEGSASLSFLRAIAPGAGGEAAFKVRFSGPPGARRTAASVDLNDVSLIDPKRQLALAGLSGTVTLDRDVLETRGLRGQLNGGDLTIDGAIPVRAGATPARPLTIEGRGLFVEIPKGLRSQLDTSLTWENAAAGPRLAGRVSIASDTYREPITALAALAASLSSVSPSRPRALPSWITDTALDIRVDSVGPLVVDQSVLKVEMVPDLQLTGTVGRPSLRGQVAIQEDGRIQAGGRSYRLMDSRLEFSPATGILPRLNVIGETRVNSYLVTLRMTGPANEIETNFSSDPPLSERDVRSLLITGQTEDPARRTDTDRFAVGAVSGDVLGVAGQFVGLDSVRVGTEDLDLVSSDVNPATRLTVSKRLGTKFELVLSENLEESQSTWIVIYRPIVGYEFRLSSEDNTTQAFEFRQEITFGPGVSSRARAKSIAVIPDRIRSVSLTGEAGFRPDQVLAGTKLREGDRFDFREWLDDRDRIVRFYRNNGYFTARIVPMRTAGESTGKERPVDLQYRITRGRRTLLEVTGYTADDEFIERLRQTWSENVLFDLLGDGLTRMTRDHLIDEGFLRARVDVEVDRPEPGTGRARIRIDPGPRTDSRRFAFSGNQVMASETLQGLATSPRPDADAWKDPAPLLAEIQAAYAATGHLGARAVADPIQFTNGTATLPIRIEEGPPAHVAALQLTGVAAERRPEALDAIALPVGSAFASGMGRAGRVRLERHYRDLGYRDVHVGLTATPQGPDVGLTFAVHEGALHVVQSVEVAGVQSTRESLVSKAVRFTPGDPAGAAAASATERRLYDLGTFRRAEVLFEPGTAAPEVEGTVPVKAIVSVEESRRFQLRYGLELSSEYNSALSQRTNSWGVAGDLRDRNFLGRGMSLGGGLRYEPDLKSVRSLFSIPRLAGRPIRTNVYLTGRGEEDTSDQQVRVRDDEVELSIEQRWRVGRSVEYSWGYSSNWRDTELTPPARTEPLAFAGTLASLNGAAVIDRRDSFFDAKRGWFGSVSTQWGRQELGSDLDYLRTLFRGSYYQPFGPIVLAGNARFGRLHPLGGVPPLTIFDLFFNAGGTESVRGYSQDELSAYDFFGAPLGGTKLLVFNGEIRAPLFWRLGGVLFADAGNTFAERQRIRFSELGVGIGVGLRINTPLAPIRIDLGSPRSFGKSGLRWHFSIGQMF